MKRLQKTPGVALAAIFHPPLLYPVFRGFGGGPTARSRIGIQRPLSPKEEATGELNSRVEG